MRERERGGEGEGERETERERGREGGREGGRMVMVYLHGLRTVDHIGKD